MAIYPKYALYCIQYLRTEQNTYIINKGKSPQ